ncbi:hypothetical protein PFISCL1PPCAC_9507 [Pristionchus fissidentatus]|uniref:Uncharacterized protein n=1 Tax=Pristionchus fissidentatus TaxID=1538716 RepID=A0AAV5VJU9_9BILA|nr:hypothetical protein PFISCL1PPCAC_9507 [Pristionchus fissidentatus]
MATLVITTTKSSKMDQIWEIQENQSGRSIDILLLQHHHHHRHNRHRKRVSGWMAGNLAAGLELGVLDERLGQYLLDVVERVLALLVVSEDGAVVLSVGRLDDDSVEDVDRPARNPPHLIQCATELHERSLSLERNLLRHRVLQALEHDRVFAVVRLHDGGLRARHGVCFRLGRRRRHLADLADEVDVEHPQKSLVASEVLFDSQNVERGIEADDIPSDGTTECRLEFNLGP